MFLDLELNPQILVYGMMLQLTEPPGQVKSSLFRVKEHYGVARMTDNFLHAWVVKDWTRICQVNKKEKAF